MPRIPIGEFIDATIRWLTDHAGSFFDALSVALLSLVNSVYAALAALPSFALIAVLAVVSAMSVRRIGITVFTVFAFLLVDGMSLWTQTVQTLAVIVVATAVAVVAGIPLGVAAAKNHKVSVVVRPVLDFMQTLPVFVYLVPAVFFFGIGVVPGIVATTVFAVPPAVRLTELGIRQVDQGTVEAARAFGARPVQILRGVEMPLALRSIMTGINQVIMLALSMVVVAGLVGAEGLGGVVVQGVTQMQIGAAFEGGLAVVILAIYLDRVTGAAARSGRERRPVFRRLPALLRRREHHGEAANGQEQPDGIPAGSAR